MIELSENGFWLVAASQHLIDKYLDECGLAAAVSDIEENAIDELIALYYG